MMVRYRNLWAGVAFLAGFLTLGIAVHAKPTSIDLTVAQFFASHRTHGEVSFAKVVGTVAAPVIVALVAIGILAVWNYQNWRWAMQDFIPFALIVSSGAAATLAKSIFNRTRPGLNFSTVVDTEPGFPSSHTAAMAATGCAFLFIVVKRRLLMILAICLATVFVGLDRLVLGVHWFTDLVGSVLLALGLFFLFASLNQSLKQSSHDQTNEAY